MENKFSPARFEGQDVLRKRYFSQQPKSKAKPSSVYKGRSAIVVSEDTPFVVEYNLKNQRAMLTFIFNGTRLRILYSLKAYKVS